MNGTVSAGRANLKSAGLESSGDVRNDSLQALEEYVNEKIKELVFSKLDICLSLAEIKRKQLFRELGYASFKEYLEAERIRLHYHTAHEYAKIGEVLLRYKEELNEVNFSEEAGLKKLLLLDDALQRRRSQKDTVFRMLKDASFREFKTFANAEEQSARADSASQSFGGLSLPRLRLESTDECIVLQPSSREIIWFDTDLECIFHSEKLANDFKRHVLRAVTVFFSTMSRENPSIRNCLRKRNNRSQRILDATPASNR